MQSMKKEGMNLKTAIEIYGKGRSEREEGTDIILL